MSLLGHDGDGHDGDATPHSPATGQDSPTTTGPGGRTTTASEPDVHRNVVPGDASAAGAPPTGPPATSPPAGGDPFSRTDPLSPPGADPLTRAGVPPLPEPPWMDWAGEIPTALAERIACDCEVWRAVLDPQTGLPLDVGRNHRVVPHWIRKALHARDRGCRWPGCHAPAGWTDAHHLLEWYFGGETKIDNLLLLSYRHVRVHEGQWRIELDRETGAVWVYRPDGSPTSSAPRCPGPAQPPDARPHSSGRPRGTGRPITVAVLPWVGMPNR
jgi:hypothetical protein